MHGWAVFYNSHAATYSAASQPRGGSPTVREGAIVRVSGRLKIAQHFKAGLTMNIENKSPIQRATDFGVQWQASARHRFGLPVSNFSRLIQSAVAASLCRRTTNVELGRDRPLTRTQ